MKLLASSASKMGSPRNRPLRLLAVAFFLAALPPAAAFSQTLKIDLLKMADMLGTRYYIAEKGELPPWCILLGGVSNTGDAVETFLYPNPLESRFDLREEYIEYDEGTGLIYRFRVPRQYYFTRKQERRDLLYYYAPRDLTIPGLGIAVERLDERIGVIARASLKSAWVEDVRYNLAKERVEKKGKGLLSLDLPITLPKPIERIIGKGEETNLTVQGSERIAISGKSEWCSNCPKTEGMVRQSKFPDLNMQQELNVSLHGTIGEKINVEIQHSSVGTGVESTNRVRINYRGFDDDIIKLIEMGDTDLSLAGAQLVSYSGTAKGLFGVKALATVGPLDLTVVASKEEGETASGSYTTSGGQFSSVPVADYDFIQRQFFFFENPGKDFQNPAPGFRDVYPVVGAAGAGGDEIEVFVSLKPEEYSDPTIFKYGAKAYTDTLNNGLNDDMVNKPFRALVKQLFMEEGDFTLIQDYGSESNDRRYIGIELAYPLDEARALMVRYKARHTAAGPHQGQEFLVGDYKRQPGSDTDSLIAEVICLPKDASSGERATDPTWTMMMRNVYSLGLSQIDANSLRVRIEDTSNRDNRYIHPASNLSYLRIFGLDQIINSTGLTGKDDLIDNLPGIIDFERGYLMFPWFEPFNPPPEIVHAFLSDTTDSREKDFEYSSITFDADLYNSALTENMKTKNNHYNIVIEASSGQRVFQLSAYDIIDGSEVVTVDGVKLARGSDYDIDYTSGIVTLKTSILPDSKINIDYQHKPLIGGGKNSLLGFGANLNISPNFRINGTFLYSSMGAPKYTPRLGEEPSRMMAADINGSFVFYPKWMTTMTNLLPRVDTNAQSSLNIGGEVAVSLPNPNVKGRAIVDDMEGVEEADQVNLLRRGWYEASPAYDTTGVLHGPATEMSFFWYNAARTAKQEYFITSRRDLNPALDERENSTVTTLFLDAIKPVSGQWCGVMTGFPGGGLDLSTAQYLEIWVNDFDTIPANRGGTVHIDFGRIDEDFYQPDSNRFDNEDKMPYGWTIYEDTGFDGETCTYPGDFSDANWIESQYTYRGINCRKGNSMQDSEDLNNNGYLDEINAYYTVSFDLADSADIDIQRDFSKRDYPDYWNDPDKKLNPRKAWRKYRIDLSKARKVFGEPRIDAIQHMRIWIEGVDSLMAFNDSRLIEFSELQFVGNRWEFNGIRNLADSLDSSGAAPGQRLIVGAINNKDDASQYEAPYRVEQEEGISNKEGSLRLDFENFAGLTSFRIMKRFFGQGQNYQQYRDLQFFVRPNYSVDDLDMVDFYIQIAYDSVNYYEIEVPFTAEHSRQWIWANIDLRDLTNLKLEADRLNVDKVTKQIRDKIDGRIYNATLRGNPTLFNVRFIYVGLRNRTDRLVSSGEVWFNDIRLGGVRRDIDHAENMRFSADFAGILQVNGSWTRTGPEFRSLRQSRGSGSTNSGLNLSGKTSLNYFLPTAGFTLPVSLQYNTTSSLPKYMLNSDVEIADPNVRSSLENVSTSYGFSVSMSRRGSSNYIMKNLFDNMRTAFSYSKRGSYGPTNRDTAWTMNGSLSYQVQFRDKRQLTLFRGIKWRYWLSSLSYETSANRQTRQGYTLSGDTTFVKRPFFYNAGWQNAVNTRYEPFESVKIDFSLSEQRDLGVDHELYGIPIGVETGFGHNVSLVFQPSRQVFLLSEFNPRFDFKSRYSEDLSPGKRQVKRTYNDTTYVTTCDPVTHVCTTEQIVRRVTVYDPFGTRAINNGRTMTFAFIVDAGRYIMGLGKVLHLVEKGETVGRRAHAFGGTPTGPMTAADAAKAAQEDWKQKQQAKKSSLAKKPIALGDLPPPHGAKKDAAEQLPEEQPKEPTAGKLGDIGARRAQEPQGTGAKADTISAAADTTRGPKRDPLLPLRRLIRFLGSVEPVSANIVFDHRSYYDRIYDRAGVWYQLGFTDRSGVPSATDSIADNIPVRATNSVSVNLRSSVALTADIGLEVKGAFDMGQNDFDGRRTKTNRATWPTLTLDWKGLEKYRFLNRYMRQSNLVVGYEQRKTVSQMGEERSFSLNPTWNLEWKNTLSSNVGVNYSKKTQMKNNLELWDKTWGVTLGLKYDIKGSQGFGIPLPFLNRKKISFNSVLTTALNLRYSRASTQIDPASSVLSVSPNVSYRFSNNVTGGLAVSYQRTKGGRLGQVRQMVDVRMNAEFRF
jgi:hypothetical protein